MLISDSFITGDSKPGDNKPSDNSTISMPAELHTLEIFGLSRILKLSDVYALPHLQHIEDSGPWASRFKG